MMKLRVGDRVRGYIHSSNSYTGTVYSVKGDTATIERDDGFSGSGEEIDGYGYGWLVQRRDSGTWGADKNVGELTIISSKNNMKPLSLIKRLLSKEDRLLSKYVFDENGNLDFSNGLVQEALLATDGFKKKLVSIVTDYDKESKKKKDC